MSGIGGGSGGAGGGGSIGMSGSSMYTEAPDQGSTSSWGQSYGAGGSSGASAGLSVPSAGLTSSTPVADTRVSTQVRGGGWRESGIKRFAPGVPRYHTAVRVPPPPCMMIPL